MQERLIEYWLDSANERSYQPAFIQMLVSEGHRVLHSTRHTAFEFGKDVISIAPDGVPCAYQLKGNPGGRLTHGQLREIKPQLDELVSQAITYPGVQNVKHRSYLVTNGLIEEEVQRAIQDMNITWERNGYGLQAISVLQRGYFIKQSIELGSALWPFAISNIDALVSMLSPAGEDILPQTKLNTLLASIYRFRDEKDDEREKPPRGPELNRLTTSAALLVSIAIGNFARQQNHFAVISAWVLFSTYTMAACARIGEVPQGTILESIEAARQTVFDSIASLAEEATKRTHLVEGVGWTDTEFYHARLALVHALMGVCWLWCRLDGLSPPVLEKINAFLPSKLTPRALWGEAAVPQILCHYWVISARDPSYKSELILSGLLEIILASQLDKDKPPLASPYYDAADVFKHNNLEYLGTFDDPYEHNSGKNASYFAEGLLHLLVRANLKDRCKVHWPNFTRVSHRRFEVAEPWQFGSVRSARGLNHDRIVRSRCEWAALQEQASNCDTPKVPIALRNDPIMLLLFVILAPQRATPDVIRFLGSVFSEVWFLPQKRPHGRSQTPV